ncbi:porin family protein [Mesorhizobium plurifarium]|uniref:outer membrane protein n=1 Tax=Sinorhizobium arboris TaxID=76745 RepID=UPI0004801535|nr:outer membrane protein [Sinorhizobium arboris]PST18588.1 porin family protein [Mesorhizobium plurifarium]
MDWRRGFCSAAFCAGLLVPYIVLAADEELLDAPEITISTEGADGGRLYLRGDIAYAPWMDEGDPFYRSTGGAGSGDVSFDSARFDKPASAAIGLGYRFTDVLRGDLTAEYFEGRFDGSSLSASPCAGEGAGTGCAFSHRANFSALGLMANGYVDLATLAGFTPYLGAGIGTTRIDWKTVRETATCVGSGGACTGASDGVSYGGRDSWRFTYALMAGVAYDVTDRLKFDAGYRYSKIADGDMFGSGADGAKGYDDGFSRHEFRVGLRFALW